MENPFYGCKFFIKSHWSLVSTKDISLYESAMRRDSMLKSLNERGLVFQNDKIFYRWKYYICPDGKEAPPELAEIRTD